MKIVPEKAKKAIFGRKIDMNMMKFSDRFTDLCELRIFNCLKHPGCYTLDTANTFIRCL